MFSISQAAFDSIIRIRADMFLKASFTLELSWDLSCLTSFSSVSMWEIKMATVLSIPCSLQPA